MTETASQIQDLLFNTPVKTADNLVDDVQHVAQLDLVCSQHVLAEKEKLYTRSADQKYCRMTGLFLSRTFLLILILVGFGIFLTGLSTFLVGSQNHIFSYNDYGDDSFSLLPVYLWFAEMAALGLYAMYRYGHKPFPTNVMVAPAGLRFAWRFKGNTQSESIPWSVIKEIHAMYRPGVGVGLGHGHGHGHGPQEIVLRFEIDQSKLNMPQTISIWKQTDAMSRGLNVPRPWDKMYINFPLDSLSLEADKFRLLSAVKEMAPKNALAHGFDEIFTSDTAPTYTEMWLDDMQTFRRQSVHELPGETTLNEGRYKIIDKIATGGQAKIYKALDTATDTYVALKELVLPVNAGADVRNRSFANVKKEAALLAGLDHPGILKLFDNFVEDHRAYLVFEYINGSTLRLMVQEDGPLDVGVAASSAIAICDILEYLHTQTPPVVHRDLAPDNLMMTDDGKIVLLDFNFAQQLESNATRTVVGKHNYMAPEQFKGKPCEQSDLYSLGCTLYYLLTGKDPTPISSSRPNTSRPVPAALDDVVAKLTALDLAIRYKSAKDAAADLAAAECSHSK